jgi:tetratricopeptide (TPR) repeat protein
MASRALIVRLAVVVAALLVAGRAKGAQEGATTPKALYEEGVTDYNLGHYAQALASFEHGYRIRRDPAFLFNIGQCNRQLHRYEEAEQAYRAYLRETNVPPETREQVQKLITEMHSAIAEQRAKTPEAATLPTVTPPPASVAVASPSGAPSVAITRPAPKHRRNVPAWILGGVGIAAVAIGGGLLGVAASRGHDANAAMTFSDQSRLHADDLSFQRAGWPLLAVGSAACATAVVLFAVEGL